MKGRLLQELAVGERIVSAFNGPADLASFDLITHKITDTTIKPTKNTKSTQLELYYQQVRDYRESKNTTISRNKVFQELKNNYPTDWLLSVELYELAKISNDIDFEKEIVIHLENIKRNNPKLGHLIDDGLALLNESFVI